MRRLRRSSALLVALAPIAAMGMTVPTARSDPALPDLGAVQLKLTQVATMTRPLVMAVRPGDREIYVGEKGGRVRTLSGKVVLDITAQVNATQIEQGLLGLAFSPDGQFLYVTYTDSFGGVRLAEFPILKGLGNIALPGTGRTVLYIDKPDPRHNGGNIQFGPDGLLWFGTGDGGLQGDPRNYAQSPGSLLGKILRIDPHQSGTKPYTVPADNPFVHTPGFRPEIWAYGFRNPWRWSFDSANGDLWIGDVGQDLWEEVDFHAATSPGGGNYGWARFEGNHRFSAGDAPGAIAPILEYSHLGGARCAVTGGYVYRSPRIAPLLGVYLFADVCDRFIFGLTQVLGKLVDVKPLLSVAPNIVSFGQDQAGELYAMSYDGGVYRLDPA